MSLDLSFLDKESIGNFYDNRISYLQNRGLSTSHIEKGINEVDRVLDNKIKSFVIHGEPQSGKTEFMIALTCKILDRDDFETIFIIMNDNKELEVQNFKRFQEASQINPGPQDLQSLESLSDDELKVRKKRIIFCRKNKKNLEKVIELCRFMKNRLVIDDEADFATPNTKINKKDEQTAINELVGKLGIFEEGSNTYIGVTATPARLDLNNTFGNQSKHWIYLESHPNYKGWEFFFPIGGNKDYEYILTKLPSSGDDPKYIRTAVFKFLIRTTILNIGNGDTNGIDGYTPYSMLIHTAGKTNDHIIDQKEISKILEILGNRDHRKFNNYIKELLDLAERILKQHNKQFSNKDIVRFIIQNIGRKEVLIINSKNDHNNVNRACDPKILFTFAIGGNIVSRGLTFKNLLSFFFSRNVKGKLQQNTYIQRARMFGVRPYSEFFELSVPEDLFMDWMGCFFDHHLSIAMGKSKDLFHLQGRGSRVIDSGALDKKNIKTDRNETEPGEVFELTKDAESQIIEGERNGINAIEIIETLIKENKIPESSFSKSIIQCIKNLSNSKSKMLLVDDRENDGKKIQLIENYSGNVDYDLIRRPGVVSGILSSRPLKNEYNHFIMPMKNKKGMMRFIYFFNTNKSIIRNIKYKV